MTRRHLLGILCLGWALWPPTAHAHDFHFSQSEAEFNRETNRLEVAIRVINHDLERALSHHFGKNKALALEEADPQLATYLTKVFRLRCPNTAPAELVWIGKEIEVRESWLYFEFPVADSLEGCTIENRLLFELEPTQLNTLQLKIGEASTTVNLSRERPGYRVERRAEESAPP